VVFVHRPLSYKANALPLGYDDACVDSGWWVHRNLIHKSYYISLNERTHLKQITEEEGVLLMSVGLGVLDRYLQGNDN
jgi:hypothetical protein